MPVKVGVVVIGRNEGERLRKCFESLGASPACVVYVDSGSTDGSVAMARAAGVEVVELDMQTPFTAARARNAGFSRLRAAAAGVQYVQFVDGDCELAGGWLEKAAAYLEGCDGAAVVCGRLREKHPERSIYNLLCDIEWDAAAGETRACGGIAMMRAAAFEYVRGFRDDMIAGEEPELCVRLRAAGWRIWRLDADMARHDAAMLHFRQWWKRSLRTGYSYALGADLHGAPPERHRVQEWRSAWFWGLGVPAAAGMLALVCGPWALLLLLAYPLQLARLAMRGSRAGRENWWRAAFLMLGKFPEMLGQVKFLSHRHLGGRARLIEHK